MPFRSRSETRSVRVAAVELRKALALPEVERAGRVREATAWLLATANEQGRERTGLREQYFVDQAFSEQTTISAEGALAQILDVAQTAHILIAAADAVNGISHSADTSALDRAIDALDSTTDFTTASHFMIEQKHSPDLPSARQTLRLRVNESLETLITEAQRAGSNVVERFRKIDATKAFEALASLGGPFERLPDLSVLVQAGVEKLQSAFEWLIRLLGSDCIKDVKNKLIDMLAAATDGTLLRSFLALMFEQQQILSAFDKLAALSALTIARIDAASDLLPLLNDGFKKKMNWVTSLTAAVASCSALMITLDSAAAANLTAFAAAAYLLVLVAILLVGRDYAGHTGIFHDGNGILGVIESLTA
jgi:hypothetical protein